MNPEGDLDEMMQCPLLVCRLLEEASAQQFGARALAL
jgi:hypothetical protein